MICLVACGAATLGSRWWLLAAASQRALSPVWAHLVIAATAIVAVGGGAWFGATLAAQFRGPGMLLLLALALLLASAGLAWPCKPLSAALRASLKGPVSAMILLFAAMLSDSAPFITLAAAARTGNAVLAGVGGAAGLMVAAALAGVMAPQGALPRWLHWLRRSLAAILFAVGAIAATSALGIL